MKSSLQPQAAPKPYVYQEYPKMKYKKSKEAKEGFEAKIVKSKAHEDALGKEWEASLEKAIGKPRYDAPEVSLLADDAEDVVEIAPAQAKGSKA
jgi:hypothetical protein